MIDPQSVLDAIKDYGAAIISTVSVGGIATATAIIVKIKKVFDDTKSAMNKALAKKDEALAESTNQINGVIEQNKALLNKIDVLTNDVYKLEGEIKSVKGNKKD